MGQTWMQMLQPLQYLSSTMIVGFRANVGTTFAFKGGHRITARGDSATKSRKTQAAAVQTTPFASIDRHGSQASSVSLQRGVVIPEDPMMSAPILAGMVAVVVSYVDPVTTLRAAVPGRPLVAGVPQEWHE